MTTRHDRNLERAVARFEEGQEKLYRKDGSRYFGDEEHREREERLVSEFGERVDAIISEAEGEATRHEEEALALSYEDPTAGLTAGERSRLADARVFVQEDCVELPLTALEERLRALSLGEDRAGQGPVRPLRAAAPGSRGRPCGRAGPPQDRRHPPGSRARGPPPPRAAGGGPRGERRGCQAEGAQAGRARQSKREQGGGAAGAQEAHGDGRRRRSGGGGADAADARDAVGNQR